MGRVMLKPTVGAPASDAPRLAASMMPGPPPVAITLSRTWWSERRAPPRSDAIRPKCRASSYQRFAAAGGRPADRTAATDSLLLAPGATRALPNTTIVERTD